MGCRANRDASGICFFRCQKNLLQKLVMSSLGVDTLYFI